MRLSWCQWSHYSLQRSDINEDKDQPNYLVPFHSHGQQGEHAHTNREIRREQVDAAVD